MPALFANKLAQKVFSYLMNKAGFDARKAINLVSEKMNNDQALIKLMKEYGYKPTKAPMVDKALGPGGKK